MVLGPNLKENLTLMDAGSNSRFLVPLIVLLVGAVLAAAIFYFFAFTKSPRKPGETVAANKPVISLKAEQKALAVIKTLVASNNTMQARQQCYELLQDTTNAPTVGEVENILGKINVELLVSPAVMPEKIEYVVQPGDILEQLAKKNGTTVELIRKCNALQGKTIHPGDRLRIFNSKLSMIISKNRNYLLLRANNRFFKRYAVGTGKFGTTPVGTFIVADKIPEPPWWRPDGKMIPYGDKENVLGTRWMSLAATGTTPKVRGYGIHGTWEPETIGKQASAGCVRLHNADVEELFLIVPTGTPVIIVE